MIPVVFEVNVSSVTVLSADRQRVKVPVELTRWRDSLTQETKRLILATGVMRHYGHQEASSPHMIDGFLHMVRDRVLWAKDTAARPKAHGHCAPNSPLGRRCNGI